MEQIKALLAVAFFIAALIFSSPIIGTQSTKDSSTRKIRKVAKQIVPDTVTNKTQYNLQPDSKYDLAKD